MNNKKGQSLVEVIFSVGVVILVLTGIVVLAVNTAKSRNATYQRQRAVELTQKLIEAEVKKAKDDPITFWNTQNRGSSSGYYPDMPDYAYNIDYVCNITGSSSDNCNAVFTVNWGNNESLSVQRFFSKKGL